MIIHRNERYIKLTKESNPKEGDLLYRLPQPEDGDIGALECKVTKWGAEHHGEEDLYLIQVETLYSKEYLEYIRKKYGKKEMK